MKSQTKHEKNSPETAILYSVRLRSANIVVYSSDRKRGTVLAVL